LPKIAFIGAGSVVFTKNLCSDILLTPALQGSTITLMDIAPERLEQARQIVQALVNLRGQKARVEVTTDRREALTDANYVITTFQQGGLDVYKLDIEIPQKYGVGQCVGDTLGPGGVFRGLRTIPVLLDICDDLDEVAPGAMLINYVNPMAANSWAVSEATERPYVGLCHSVQGTTELLAKWIGVSYEDVVYLCAGINHQAWVLEFRRRDTGDDLYPLIWKAIEKPEIYGEEPVRIDLMKHFGYFVTESSGHASEYAPYFRKTARMVEKELVPRFKSENDHWFRWAKTGGYLEFCSELFTRYQQGFEEELEKVKNDPPTKRTREYGSCIIEAMETHEPTRINGNVSNWGLVDNLPTGCCVEVPCLVDGNGVQPTAVGLLPPQLAALNRTNVNVQELTVEAALTGDVEAVYHAVMLDPLTSAVCTLPQIHDMVSEMLEAEARWLPQFDLA
jgi:alpha-galactosidase